MELLSIAEACAKDPQMMWGLIVLSCLIGIAIGAAIFADGEEE